MTDPVLTDDGAYAHHTNDSSPALIAVLLAAAVLIVGFLLYAMQVFPFNAVGPNGETQAEIDSDLPDTAPGSDVNPDDDMTPSY